MRPRTTRTRARNFFIGVACLAAGAFSAVALAGPPGQARHRPKPPFTVEVIGFNDCRGTLQSPGSFGVNTSTKPGLWMCRVQRVRGRWSPK